MNGHPSERGGRGKTWPGDPEALLRLLGGG
jgi:hypothetical protein